MKIRSEVAEVGIHSRAAGAQSQIAIKLNTSIQNALGFVCATAEVAPIGRVASQLSHRAPKVANLREPFVVNGPELEDAEDSASRRRIQVILQTHTRIFETHNGVSHVAAIHAVVLILITIIVAIIGPVTIDLC
jgi:hypothetical protein